MQGQDNFKNFHPIVNISYFAIVLLISMFLMHPVIICISVIMGIFYQMKLKGIKKTLKELLMIFTMCAMIIVINPLFNHEGMTIIAYFKSGNPLTLESIIYGIFMALLMAAVVIWFGCYNVIMTSDKFIYLFGRIIPNLSLVLSMALRFIPRFKIQFAQVRYGRKCVNKDISDGNVFAKIRNMAEMISIMISWLLENAIETADSMKSRGYGLFKRTSFSIYKFEKRDASVLLILFILTSVFVLAIASGKMYYRYFPTFEDKLLDGTSIMMYGIFTMICAVPIIINFVEDRRWKYLESTI